MEKPLINKKCLLQKYPGKGGWTYAIIPGIKQDKKVRFGWVKVRGHIDDYEIKNVRLMPMGDGRLFLTVKAEIRKKIRKEEGDWIKVVLFADRAPAEIPRELILCLKDDPTAHKNFMAYSDAVKKQFTDWISGARTDETKVRRIALTIDKASRGEKFTVQKISDE
ncbi:MAG: YdeI/OmpD-associated family protein [Bacteroidia bacterium]